MGTPLGPKYIPYNYMDPLGIASGTLQRCVQTVAARAMFFEQGLLSCMEETSLLETSSVRSKPNSFFFRSLLIRLDSSFFSSLFIC